MRCTLLVLLFVALGSGQKPKAEAFFRERAELQKQAKTGFDAELAREKAGDCPQASTTLEINSCLAGELDKSTGNYQMYAGSLRKMLAQPSPFGAAGAEAAGPTGKPLTEAEMLRDFDQAEAMWGKYREALCTGAFGLYKGGTIVHSVEYGCQLMVLRSHMRELAKVYGEYLSH